MERHQDTDENPAMLDEVVDLEKLRATIDGSLRANGGFRLLAMIERGATATTTTELAAELDNLARNIAQAVGSMPISRVPCEHDTLLLTADLVRRDNRIAQLEAELLDRTAELGHHKRAADELREMAMRAAGASSPGGVS